MMRLVIRSERPLFLRELAEPLRRLLPAGETDRFSADERVVDIMNRAAAYRPFCREDDWAAEEEALRTLMTLLPENGQRVALGVQCLPVPAGLPVPLLTLLEGWMIREEDWPPALFSPLAMLWLQAVGARPLARLEGRLAQVEHGEGVAVIRLESEARGDGTDVPVVKERRQHEEEHIDEGMYLLQANLDDSSPEWLAHVLDRLLAAGANDVHFLPATMKKSRPGVLLQALCYGSRLDELKSILFRETTTFGVRYFPVSCHRLARRVVTAATPWGDVPVKLGYHRGERVQTAPEYDVCARLAKQAGVPLKQVYQQALLLAESAEAQTRQEEEGGVEKWKREEEIPQKDAGRLCDE
ncbi:nickel insertion protein [Brevibacillus thermoruber]|jgi:pyridinium-3,5-bisthiocarboxylic acid mononucleotide nickel chelatase|uniref:nickel insertion protein n=1 Tax=Brevibacillus thermoruber TaxID=33942 RepID=UPI001EE65D22|nr:nickel insertion protein [Brevibacillus thermoruber]